MTLDPKTVMKLNFDRSPDGLIPAIVQDSETKNVLMLGYMNQEAFDKTIELQQVTFYSRSKKRLWTKGEESGHVLQLISIKNDCDGDTLLVAAIPKGPTCHKGTDTCWAEENNSWYGFLSKLEAKLVDRKNNPSTSSYVSTLYAQGLHKIAQKLGEEAIETVIEAMRSEDQLFLNESADLLFHYMVLLQAKGYALHDVVSVLRDRAK